MSSTPERLAYWYFRLNGFTTIEDFVVHPDIGTQQRTDVDLIGVRFQHRSENASLPMQDDPRIAQCSTFANVIISEVKTGNCALNGPWTDPDKRNMQRVLSSIGCVAPDQIEIAASELYTYGIWVDENVTIRLFAIGESKSDLRIPSDQQITWREIIAFCHQRFSEYRKQKSSIGIWRSDGERLKRLAEKNTVDEDGIRKLFSLRPNNQNDSSQEIQ